MGLAARAATVATLASVGAACSWVTGASRFEKADCVTDCDGGAEGGAPLACDGGPPVGRTEYTFGPTGQALGYFERTNDYAITFATRGRAVLDELRLPVTRGAFACPDSSTLPNPDPECTACGGGGGTSCSVPSPSPGQVDVVAVLGTPASPGAEVARASLAGEALPSGSGTATFRFEGARELPAGATVSLLLHSTSTAYELRLDGAAGAVAGASWSQRSVFPPGPWEPGRGGSLIAATVTVRGCDP